MRITLILLLSFFIILFVSAQKFATPQRAPMDVFVFVDKSKSVDFRDSTVRQRAENAVRALLAQCTQTGDRIGLYYLHGNTAGARAEHSLVIPALVYPARANSIERNHAQQTYYRNLSLLRGAFVKALRTQLLEPNATPTANATDILGTLEVVSSVSAPGRQLHVLLLTDGVQAANGFGANPRSQQEAVARAAADVRRLPAQYRLNSRLLQAGDVRMVMPFTAIGSKHNRFLDRYWAEVFEGVGMRLVVE